MNCKIFLLLFISHYLCYADDFLSFIDKIFRAAGMTAVYTITLGNNYFNLEQEVTFWCFTPGGQTYMQVFINDPNVNIKMDMTKPLNFVVHGFLQSFRGGMAANYQAPLDSSWVYPLSSDWAKYANANTCAVDWSRLAFTDYSVAASRNTRIVANQMIEFMNYLIGKGMKIDLVSVAGHSLGAHIAGFFGHGFKGQLNAIFGLDAAGPGFTTPLVLNTDSRLDPTDAKFVQCLHTSKVLGTKLKCGHADYIANDGEIQPGCGINPLCNHSRAPEIFRYSLNPQNRFTGTMCLKGGRGSDSGLIGNLLTSFTTIFLKTDTLCTSTFQDLFGIYTKRYSGDYRFETTSTAPFVKL